MNIPLAEKGIMNMLSPTGHRVKSKRDYLVLRPLVAFTVDWVLVRHFLMRVHSLQNTTLYSLLC